MRRIPHLYRERTYTRAYVQLPYNRGMDKSDRIEIRWPPALAARLQAEAERRDTTVSEFVRQAVRRELERPDG